MDYLRTLGSAAVSTLVQKSGLNLPFSLGTKVTTFDGICNLYDGTKRDDGSPVSIFEYDFSDASRKQVQPLAINALRKLRTTRHPDVLKFMDGVESDTSIYIMTERVRPLRIVLQGWSSREAQEREDWLLWGLHRISIALTFINDPCASNHGKICTDSIFISHSGEWKLGGFEAVSNPKDDSAVLYSMGGMLPSSSSWASPEIKKGGWTVLKEYNPGAQDAYMLGILLHTVFNPTYPPPATAEPPHPPPTNSSRGAIPVSVFPSFKKLLNPNPRSRLTSKGFLEIGMAVNGFFATNRLVKVCLSLDNFALDNEADKNSLLRTLKESSSSFPPEFASYRVLPSLISALEFGGASAATILPLVLHFGKNVSPDEYSNVILAPIVKLFAAPDRGIRMALLDNLSDYAEKLDKKTVSDKIFPHLQTGFSDTVAIIREATTKSIILLAPKLTDRLLNNDLLRLLAKMQTDPEASIRTNTCILLGRLAPSLGYNTKRKVLVPAFTRALKDSFVHARVAALMAFLATADCFEIDDIATRVIPNISSAMIDKEKLVRVQAFKAIEFFVKKLETHAASMPDSAAPEAIPASIPGAAELLPGTFVSSASGAAGALAGWAISSLGKKLATSDMQSPMPASVSDVIQRSSSAPNPPGGFSPESHVSELRKESHSAAPSQSAKKTKSLQLSVNKARPHLIPAELETQLTEEAVTSANEANPWGSDDLIDVNADEDDWSAFESAPALVEPKPIAYPNDHLINADVENSLSLDDPWKSQSAVENNPWKPSLTSKSHPHLSVRQSQSSSQTASLRSTPVSSPRPPDDSWGNNSEWDDAKPNIESPLSPLNMGIMTKEEKAAEIARRKEERKQRIALLKEQKKNAIRT